MSHKGVEEVERRKERQEEEKKKSESEGKPPYRHHQRGESPEFQHGKVPQGIAAMRRRDKD